MGGVGGFFLGGVQELLIGKGTEALPWYRGITVLGSKRFSWGVVIGFPLLRIIPSFLFLQSLSLPKHKPTFRIVKSIVKYSKAPKQDVSPVSCLSEVKHSLALTKNNKIS